MTTDLVSHQLVRYLEHRGVAHVFGLCGHTNIAVLAALSKSEQIEFVNTRHEQIASHAADGYARATGRASVVLSHLGPGLTNAATGVANAALDSVPMVVIAGDVPSHYYGKHPHQEVNPTPTPPSGRSTAPSSSGPGGSIPPTSSPRSSTRPSRWPRAAARAPCSSTCRWTSSRRRSTSPSWIE